MEENKSTMDAPKNGWRKLLIAAGSGVVLGFLVVAANGILGGPIQFVARPPESNSFKVDIPGVDTRSSQFVKLGEVVSMSATIAPPVDPNAPEGTVLPPFVALGPGPLTIQPVTLERVYKGPDELFNWRMRIESGAVDPRDVSITLLDPLHHPIRHVTLVAAYPSSWTMPEVGADGQPGHETITFIAKQVREDR